MNFIDKTLRKINLIEKLDAFFRNHCGGMLSRLLTVKNALDPRFVITLISIWMMTIFIYMISSGFTNSEFFSFGPSKRVKFFQLPIDTWGKYIAVVCYTLINQFVQTYGLETITPWMLNNVQNKKELEMEISPVGTQIIIQLWYIYLWSGRIFGIQIMLSQIDLLMFVLFSDLLTYFTIIQLYISYKAKSRKNQDEEALIIHNDTQ